MRKTRITRYFGQAIGAFAILFGGYCWATSGLENNLESGRNGAITATNAIERDEAKKNELEGIAYAVTGAAVVLLSRYGKLDARNRIKDYQPSANEENDEDDDEPQERDCL